MSRCVVRWNRWTLVWLGLSGAWAVPAQASDKPVYRCPGSPVLYTDALSAKEARDKGCTTLEGAPITIVGPSARTAPSSGGTKPPAAPPAASSRGGESRIDPNEQRVRDNDAKKILAGELQKEEENLARLKKDYNNGEPERQGDERNYQKYLERVAEMKAQIARKEGDVAALKRELGKLN